MAETDGESVLVGDVAVVGVGLDAETRCVHYGSVRDVVAIEFACCGRVHPCADCHDALADHEPRVWPRVERGVHAVLCGSCGDRLSIQTYLDVLETDRSGGGSAACPGCGAPFNPGCLDHVGRYFEQ